MNSCSICLKSTELGLYQVSCPYVLNHVLHLMFRCLFDNFVQFQGATNFGYTLPYFDSDKVALESYRIVMQRVFGRKCRTVGICYTGWWFLVM